MERDPKFLVGGAALLLVAACCARADDSRMTRVRVRINGAAGGAVVVIGPDTTREDFINAAKMKLFSGFGGQVSGRLIDPRET